MQITPEAVKHIAHLSRLHVSDAEVAEYARQLTAILEHVDQLRELDTRDVAPFVHPLDTHNVFRADKPIRSYERDQILQNAPRQENGFFIVPKVLD